MSKTMAMSKGTVLSKTGVLEKGIACPKCGCRHFEVLYTRKAVGGKVVRRRECRHCGRRITTWERAIGTIQ